jgi:hypothetical protein
MDRVSSERERIFRDILPLKVRAERIEKGLGGDRTGLGTLRMA